MRAVDVARILAEMGTLLEIQGENPFRCRAYHNAADALRGVGDLDKLVVEGRLEELPGVGETIRAKVVELVTTGRLEAFERLRAETPPGLVALLRVPGLGPKKIKGLHDAIRVESLADLREAAESGAIAGLKGFGAKTEAKILEGLRFVESSGNRILQSTAGRLVGPILDALRADPAVSRAEPCGELRRRAETVDRLGLVFEAEDPGAVLDRIAGLPSVASVIDRSASEASILLDGGVPCDLLGVATGAFPVALHALTGSAGHLAALRRYAEGRGVRWVDGTLIGPNGPLSCATEAELFEILGLRPIPPELREDDGEIEGAEAGTLPELVTRADLRGTFHCHTDWSDGGNSLVEMANAARERGLSYLGIADHSRSAAYAGGLSIDRVRRQWDEIDAMNAAFGDDFRLFKGIECDILADGALDYPIEILEGFDYVVASVHSGFGQSREAMTARIVRAVSHPLVTMLGHPTGRLLLRRDAYDVDLEAVIDAAAESGTLIEINANPHRLDLDAPHARMARSRGVTLVVNPDAHSINGLDDLEYGIGVARRAWLEPADLFNTANVAEVDRLLRARRLGR